MHIFNHLFAPRRVQVPIRLWNSLSRTLEDFRPLRRREVRMYHCGPTVYGRVHIGNLRSYLFADSLRRMFELNDYRVRQVINITDVGHLVSEGDEGEDKMTKALRESGKPLTLEAMSTLADENTEAFKRDLADLNILTPERFPRASDFIEPDIAFIRRLEQKGFSYNGSDGVYFDTAKADRYGKLGLPSHDTTTTRINAIGKRNPRDFALWKFSSGAGWESPWGKGFPGWHLECSVMAIELLGDTMDVHTGGIDHIPVHHNNEIAQAEAATGKSLAQIWMHNEFLTISAGKMAKSVGNVITLDDLRARGYSPIAYRYLVLGASYRSPISFTWEALGGARAGYRRLVEEYARLPESAPRRVPEDIRARFMRALNNDIGTPEALAQAHEVIKSQSLSPNVITAALDFMDRALGLDLRAHANRIREKAHVKLPEEIVDLLRRRDEARRAGDWNEADKLRGAIESHGYQVADTSGGSEIRPEKA